MTTIGHIADLHLGYGSGRKKTEDGINIRENDGYIAFNTVIDQMINEKIDYVIVCGDVFHSPKPKMYTLIQAQKGFRRLAEAGIEVHILTGNHDTNDIRIDPSATLIIDEQTNKIHSHSEPYVLKELNENIYVHFISHHLFSEQLETMDNIEPIKNKINILATHGSCFDSVFNKMLTTEQSPREIIIPEYIMNMNWDYTFLGHIHERGWVSSSDRKTDTANRKQFYAGSLVRRGFSDKECELGRGWTKWTINEKTKKFTPKFFHVKERPQYSLKPIHVGKMSVKEIENKIISQLKTVVEKHEDDCGEISVENLPMVRQTLVGISPTMNLSINWSRFSEYIDKCFVHSFKKIRVDEDFIETDIDSETSKEAISQNKNIIQQYIHWETQNDGENLTHIDEEIRDLVSQKTKEFLKKGQDAILNES